MLNKSEKLIDPFGRAVTYLRISVTDRCDFRCVYCMSENMTFLPKKDLLTLEELEFVLNNLECLTPGGICVAIIPASQPSGAFFTRFLITVAIPPGLFAGPK